VEAAAQLPVRVAAAQLRSAAELSSEELSSAGLSAAVV
jgi:hypothetical protein